EGAAAAASADLWCEPRTVRVPRARERRDARGLCGWRVRVDRRLVVQRVRRDRGAVAASCGGGPPAGLRGLSGARREAHQARSDRGAERGLPLGSNGVPAGRVLLSGGLLVGWGGARFTAKDGSVEVPVGA